jgi:hypothetical protein
MNLFSAKLNEDILTARLECGASVISDGDASESLAAITAVVPQASVPEMLQIDIRLGDFFSESGYWVSPPAWTHTYALPHFVPMYPYNWSNVARILSALGLEDRSINPEAIVNAMSISRGDKQRFELAHILLNPRVLRSRILVLDGFDENIVPEVAASFLAYLRANFADKTIFIIGSGELMVRELAANRIEINADGIISQHASS